MENLAVGEREFFKLYQNHLFQTFQQENRANGISHIKYIWKCKAIYFTVRTIQKGLVLQGELRLKV